jgi:hypothetical protein
MIDDFKYDICSLLVQLFSSNERIRVTATWLIIASVLSFKCLCFLLLICSTPSGVLAYVYPLLIGAIWGVGDGVLNTQLSALLGMLFKNDKVLL